MSRKYFGTDGIRGVANEKLTPDLAFRLGLATGQILRKDNAAPRVVLGRDTRRSGPMLTAALGAGFCSMGVDVTDIGVAPTPTVSFIARMAGYSLGGIVSASHNPAPDNGIKFVGHDGKKLTDETELAIEAFMDQVPSNRPIGAEVGSFGVDREQIDSYVDHLVSLVPERLEGMKVAVDAAHGAAYELAPLVLELLGADTFVIGDEPDGMNINAEGGATKPEKVQEMTVECGADVGVAFDGDADRAVFSDEKGRLINGDRTIGIWSAHWRKEGKLDPAIVVGTVMSNGGFEHYLDSNGIKLERAPVGDKYVAERMVATGARIGGEQSGHIIFPEHGPTGDGLITMLQLLRVLRRENRKASEFYNDYESWPQLLVNLSVNEREGWSDRPHVAVALREAESAVQGRGRVNVRPSGTQPMIRVMVEADSYELRDQVAAKIIDAMSHDLGGSVYSRVDLTHALGD